MTLIRKEKLLQELSAYFNSSANFKEIYKCIKEFDEVMTIDSTVSKQSDTRRKVEIPVPVRDNFKVGDEVLIIKKGIK